MFKLHWQKLNLQWPGKFQCRQKYHTLSKLYSSADEMCMTEHPINKHFLYTAYNKSAIFEVRNLTRCQMNLPPPSFVWTCYRSLQIWNFNIILTYKNVQQCSFSFVVRDNQESWDSHNCKPEWIKCFKEVTKKIKYWKQFLVTIYNSEQ